MLRHHRPLLVSYNLSPGITCMIIWLQQPGRRVVPLINHPLHHVIGRLSCPIGRRTPQLPGASAAMVVGSFELYGCGGPLPVFTRQSSLGPPKQRQQHT